jgi:hypothetical protein
MKRMNEKVPRRSADKQWKANKLPSKILTRALTFVLLFGVMPAGAPMTAYAASSGSTIDVSDRATTSGTGWTQKDGGLFTVTGDVTVTGRSTSNSRIVVQSGANVTITLDNMYLSLASSGNIPAFDISGATVKLNLQGNNTIIGGRYCAGLRVPSGAALSIDGAGSLDARGGGLNGLEGAAIGGNSGEACGNVTINGGVVSAVGGTGAASIGGGKGGNGGTIRVNGGTIDAPSGNDAPIGAGQGGASAGTLTIAGGSLNISYGNAGDDSLFPTPRNASGTELRCFITDIHDPAAYGKAVTAGTVNGVAVSTGSPTGGAYGVKGVQSDTGGSIYLWLPYNGTTVIKLTANGKEYIGSKIISTQEWAATPKRYPLDCQLYNETDAVKPGGITFHIPATAAVGTITLIAEVTPSHANFKDATWSIKSAGGTGATLNGTKLTTIAAGTVTVTAAVKQFGGGFSQYPDFKQDFTITVVAASLVVSGGTAGTDYFYDTGNHQLSILTSKAMTVSGHSNGSDADHLVIYPDKTANLTFNGVDIDHSGGTALAIAAGATLNLTLQGENSLKSSSGGGVDIRNGANLTVGGTGALDASSSSGPGIGSQNTVSGAITINSGTITATAGGTQNAGLGYGSAVTINGGTVVAAGTDYEAGIGAVYINTGAVTINGGTVIASGGMNAPGIGIRNTTLAITGGTVSATGGNNTAGIDGNNGVCTITGGSVNCVNRPTGIQTTNGEGTKVYPATLTVGDLAVANTAISAGSIGGVSCAAAPNAASGIYGVKDVKTDGDGKLYFWLPAGTDTGISITAGGDDYTGTISPNTAGTAAVTLTLFVPDITPPVLSAGSVNRTSDTEAAIGFATDEAGTAYYLVLNSGATAPANTDVKTADNSLGSMSAGAVSNLSVTLTTGAKDIYVVVEDAAGNISDPLKIEAAAYVAPPAALTGTATISNMNPRIGDALTGSLESGNNTGTLSYQWKVDGTNAGTGNSYTVQTADLGKTVTLEITSDVETGTLTSTATAAVLKQAAPTAPSAPTLESKTHNSVTLMANALYGFSKDGATWQTDNVFTGLNPNTAYTFYQRVAETGDTEASAASAVLNETTNAAPLTGTATIDNTNPRIGDALNGSLVSGNNTGTLSYQWKTDGANAGTGSSYTVQTADLGKTITLEITSDVETGTLTSTATAAVLKQAAPTAPSAPTLTSKTHNSVTLTANALYEFSKDGSTWQTSNVFTGLNPNTAYTFYQRVAETGDTYASAASPALNETTNAAPVKTVSVGTQSGTLTAGTAGSVTFTVTTANIANGTLIALNNTNSVAGISLSTTQTTNSSTEITVTTTAATPQGTHPLTLTVDGVTSNSFDLVVNPVTYGVSGGSFTGGSVSADKAAYAENEPVTLTVTPDPGYVPDVISAHKTGDAGTPVETQCIASLPTVSTYTFTMPAYSVTVTATFRNPDREAVDAAKGLIEGGSYTVAQATANTETTVKTWLAAKINALAGMNATGITVTAAGITINSITPAVTGTAGNLSGTNGSFDFTVSLAKGISNETAIGNGTITATPYVSAQTPVITARPQPAYCYTGSTPAALTVTASVTDGGTLSYQWYRNTANSNTGGTAIAGATYASFTPPTEAAGITYYYVTVTNTNTAVNGSQTATATSATAAVTVVDPPIMCQILLPQVNGVTTDPPAGTYHVESQHDFIFTLTLAVPSATAPAVRAIYIPDGNDSGLETEVTPAAAPGSYTVRVRRVTRSPLQIVIELPDDTGTDTPPANAARVWSAAGHLHIVSPVAGEARVYSATGMLVRIIRYEAGATVRVPLAKGFYAVVLSGGKTWKVLTGD